MEIRHQWWRDALEADARGSLSANPVAAALADTIERFNLSRPALVALIDARGFDLYDSPMPDLPSLEAYCKNTSSVLFAMAAEMLEDASEKAGASPLRRREAVPPPLSADPRRSPPLPSTPGSLTPSRG